ncbi:MAG: hypothetical protein EOM30_09230 [Clostridia bacterium]|nr:hypothetical protein [Clostridia bacterium]NLS85458.1 SpoIIE family protein phosphatase [Oscillospiraceae bacterium]
MSAKSQIPFLDTKRAQTLRGVYEKTQPVLAVAACAAAGFLISGAQIFGTLRPFGIAFAACVNAPYALAAAGCFVVSSVITILDGGGASDVIYAAGQALIICALAYLMHPAAGVSGILSSAKTDAESRASLLTVLVVAVCSLAPYSFGLIRPAYILGAAAVLLSVYSAREYGAALSGAAVCAAIAYVIPQKRIGKIAGGAIVSSQRANATALSARLTEMSDALSSIGSTLEAVCTRMPSREQSFSEVCDAVSSSVCRSCARCGICWGSGRGDVYEAFNKLQFVLTRGVVTPEELPEPLRTSCLHPRRLAELFTVNWQRLLTRRKTIAAGKAMRGALSEQYAALAAALGSAAKQSQREEAPDDRRTKRVERLFLSLDLQPTETHVSTDSTGRVYVNVRMPRTEFTRETLLAISKEAGTLCRCVLDYPTCTQTAMFTQLEFKQPPQLKTMLGVCTRPAVGEISADAVKTFTDSCGLAHVLICDGMGTGKAAAVDGALAATLCEKLLASGFGAAETAPLVNIALSFKGDTDAGAALDALTVNLFTGEASLFKAGGAASYLVRQGVVTLLGGDSLPIGILGTVTGRTDTFGVQRGDMLVLVSDGAICGDADWLLEKLSGIKQKAPQDIAGAIVAAAKAKTARPDDITAVCVRFEAA